MPENIQLYAYAILHAIITLAKIYATAKALPSKYAKYDYDFPELIKAKVKNLQELNRNDPWVTDFSSSILKSLDSPKDIIEICMQYLTVIR